MRIKQGAKKQGAARVWESQAPENQLPENQAPQNPIFPKRRQTRLALATAGVVFLLFLSALLPALLFARLDNASFEGVNARQRVAGRLSATAEDIYLVRALHSRAQRQMGAETPAEKPAPAAISQSEILRDLTPLAEAGVLAEGSLAAVEGWLEEGAATLSKTPDGCGAILIRCDFALPERFSLVYEKEEITGKIIRFWAMGILPELPAEQPAPGAALEGYVNYCGLSEVSDWQEAQGYYTAYQQSEDAKLLAFYDSPFSFGLAPQTGQ